jgi:hypothetical protein
MVNRIWLLLGYKTVEGGGHAIDRLNREYGQQSVPELYARFKRNIATAEAEARRESARRAQERAARAERNAALRAWKAANSERRYNLHIQEWIFGVLSYVAGFGAICLGWGLVFTTLPRLMHYGWNVNRRHDLSMFAAVLGPFLLFRYLSKRANRLLEPPEHLR